MTAYLKARQIRIFDYPRFAQPLREALRQNAERLAAEDDLEIMFIPKKNFRKEDRVKEILDKRGRASPLQHGAGPASGTGKTSHPRSRS